MKRRFRLLGVLFAAGSLALAGCSGESGVPSAAAGGGTAGTTDSVASTPVTEPTESVAAAPTESVAEPTVTESSTQEPLPSAVPAPQRWAQTGEYEPSPPLLVGGDHLVVGLNKASIGERSGMLISYTADGRQVAGPVEIDGFDSGCGVRIGPSPDGDGEVMYLVQTEVTPAAGLQKEMTMIHLTALDQEFNLLWRTQLGEEVPEYTGCQRTHDLSLTHDGQWLAYTVSEQQGYVDLRTQTATPVDHNTLAIGNYIAAMGCYTCQDDPGTLDLIDPVTGETRTFPHSENRAWDYKGLFGDFIHQEFYGGDSRFSGLEPLDGDTLVGVDFVPLEGDTHQPVLLTIDLKAGTFAHRTEIGVLEFGSLRDNHSLLDPESGMVLIRGAYGFAPDKTDAPLWTLPGAEEVDMSMCAVGHGQFIIGVNDQLAVVDALTGEQVDYTDTLSSCPTRVFGDYGWYRDGEVHALFG